MLTQGGGGENEQLLICDLHHCQFCAPFISSQTANLSYTYVLILICFDTLKQRKIKSILYPFLGFFIPKKLNPYLVFERTRKHNFSILERNSPIEVS